MTLSPNTALTRAVPVAVMVVTTIGKPGVAVAAITKRHNGFVVAHVEGANKPTLNGAPIGGEPVMLKNGDLLELTQREWELLELLVQRVIEMATERFDVQLQSTVVAEETAARDVHRGAPSLDVDVRGRKLSLERH